jgi:hypothetical protein
MELEMVLFEKLKSLVPSISISQLIVSRVDGETKPPAGMLIEGTSAAFTLAPMAVEMAVRPVIFLMFLFFINKC